MASVLPRLDHAQAATFAVEMKRRRIIATIALLLLLEQSFVGLTNFANRDMSDADAGGDILRQVIILGALGLQLLAPANARPFMAVPASIVLLLGYALLTCTWAIEPSIAVRRLAYTAVVILILVRAIGDLGAVRTLNLVRATLAVLLVINYLAVMFSPYGVHKANFGELDMLDGDWMGITTHKNIAGPIAAMTALLFTFDRKHIPAWLSLVIVPASLFFLVMTGSKTPLSVLPVALLIGWGMQFYSPRFRSILLPIGIVSMALLLMSVLMFSGLIDDILDDKSSLTGRSAIWGILLRYSSEHLWTGAGYGSFWQIGYNSPIWKYTNDWVAQRGSHGHNGYLDLLVTIGLPGLILTIVVLLVWPMIRLLSSVNIARSRRGLLCAMMAFCALHNLSESTLFDRSNTVQVFLMIAVVIIHRLSDQSAGAHQMIRQRLVSLADRNGLAALRKRLGGNRRAHQRSSMNRRPVRAATRGRQPVGAGQSLGDADLQDGPA